MNFRGIPYHGSESMNRWIALFRGINVGGHNILPMAELRKNLDALGLKRVRTYIQSGNAVFDSSARSSAALSKKLSHSVEEHHGFRPQLLLLSLDELKAAVKANPYPEAASDPTTLHFTFLAEPVLQLDTAALDALKVASERYLLTDRVFYLHAPDGIGRSKLAAKVEKHLGVLTTSRNFRTVEKLVSMAEEE